MLSNNILLESLFVNVKYVKNKIFDDETMLIMYKENLGDATSLLFLSIPVIRTKGPFWKVGEKRNLVCEKNYNIFCDGNESQYF